jgi:hypothetical protein
MVVMADSKLTKLKISCDDSRIWGMASGGERMAIICILYGKTMG